MKKTYHFDDVAILPKPTEIGSRADVNLNVSYITKHSKKKIGGVPVIVANMDTVGTKMMADSLSDYGMFVALHKFIDNVNDLPDNVFFSSGMDTTNLYTFLANYSEKYDRQLRICLDVANGYMYKFLDLVKRVRNDYPEAIIMAGNVCTPDGVENIVKAGADLVKCGIGSGKKCDTKNKAGVTCGQFTVAQECGQAANELEALCCSDGGVGSPADICKALAAGSHFVMAGSIFGGYYECDSKWRNIETHQELKCFSQADPAAEYEMLMYGMSSKTANDKYFGGLKDYRTSEGLEKWIPYKGPVEYLAKDIRGSLASCCSYCNTSHLENLKKNAEFVLI